MSRYRRNPSLAVPMALVVIMALVVLMALVGYSRRDTDREKIAMAILTTIARSTTEMLPVGEACGARQCNARVTERRIFMVWTIAFILLGSRLGWRHPTRPAASSTSCWWWPSSLSSFAFCKDVSFSNVIYAADGSVAFGMDALLYSRQDSI